VNRVRVRTVSLLTVLVSVLLTPLASRAQSAPPPEHHDDLAPAAPAKQEAKKAEVKKDPPWYERISIRGYTQLRYNRIGATNPHLKNDQGDKSIGDSGGLYIRRARLLFSGDMAPFLSIYFQPEFASAVSDSLNIVQLRDWWGDIFVDHEKMFRFRVGQQKMPYGFELMQSSSNRLPFDRTDGMNSAFTNERDLGAFLMFETPDVRRRFKRLLDSGLKGSGDYGMVTTGISNGQPLNTREKNDNKHFFARVTYPFDVGSQTLELAAGGYTGRFVTSKAEGISGAKEIRDLRGHATFVLYPKPIGFQAEYNVGVGPELVGKEVVERPLDGGYVMTMVRTNTAIGYVTPYLRLHRYDGGKKFEQNAPRHEVRELNAGVEWQIKKWVELTAEFMESERIVNSKKEEGRLLRLQVQLNY
jgi:Phosphate-selective porin O and P